MEIPSKVHHLFVAAGWRPTRRVRVEDRVPEHYPAHNVLQEMGGLHVDRRPQLRHHFLLSWRPTPKLDL
jgi:hypothetical protein